MLINEEVISTEIAGKILSWRYTGGFSAHAQRRLEAEDKDGLEFLAQYIVRSPIFEEKIILSPGEKEVIYHAKFTPTLGRNSQTFDTPFLTNFWIRPR